MAQADYAVAQKEFWESRYRLEHYSSKQKSNLAVPPHTCPLCGATDHTLYHRDRSRSYRHCGCCTLVFVPPTAHLQPAAEQAYYDLHENDPADAGYRRFLARLAHPLLKRIAPGARGLDFGCGPGPALAQMLQEAGMHVRLYDRFYVPDKSVWQQQYDFICATEVVEHLQKPSHEFERFFAHLRPGGWLGVMTKRVRNQAAFATWHYITDPTHICFYSRETLQWIAKRWHATIQFPAADVALFQKL